MWICPGPKKMTASRLLCLFSLFLTVLSTNGAPPPSSSYNARSLSLNRSALQASQCSTTANTSATSPRVDLAYAIHAPQIATSPDHRTYYNFSNIRYAAPPIDSLRFQLPQDPANNRSAGIQDGVYGKMCPQAYTPWQSESLVTAPPGEAESEDCLFLDVVVPEQVWTERCNTSRPVVVWIHGGGFQIGAKWGTPMTNALGLLDRSFDDDGEGLIWIGLQYRVRRAPHWMILRARSTCADFASVAGCFRISPRRFISISRRSFECWILRSTQSFGVGSAVRLAVRR